MKYVSQIIKNEFIKFSHGKKFVFMIVLIAGMCGLAVIAYSDMVQIAVDQLPKAATYSNELKDILIHMNGIGFSKLFLTDFVYKGYFSFYILFIVLIAADVFSADNESGNMKFAFITGIKPSQLYLGKIAFIVCVSSAIVLFHFFISLLLGQCVFGGAFLLPDLLLVLILTVAAVIPAAAMAVIIALISQTRLSYKIVMGIGIALALILGVSDTLSQSKYFSPIGALSIFNESVPGMSNKFLLCLATSCFYLVLGFVCLRLLVRRRDYFA